MFGISPVEFVVILVVLVLVVKPEELPKVLRTVGRYYGQFLAWSHKMRQVGRETFNEVASLDAPADGSRAPAIPEFRRPLDQPTEPPPRPPVATTPTPAATPAPAAPAAPPPPANPAGDRVS